MKGGITAIVDAHDLVRDGMYATRSSASADPTGVDGITIRPHEVRTVEASPISISLTIITPSLPILGSINFSQTIFTSPAFDTSVTDSDLWNRVLQRNELLRIGTDGAQSGDTSGDERREPDEYRGYQRAERCSRRLRERLLGGRRRGCLHPCLCGINDAHGALQRHRHAPLHDGEHPAVALADIVREVTRSKSSREDPVAHSSRNACG